MKNLSKRSLAILIVVFLLASIVLMVFRATIQEIFVVPLLYLVWLGNLIFTSIHQVFFWGILILLAIVLLFRNLRKRPGFRRRRDRPTSEGERNQRVTYWLGQIQLNDGETYRDLYTLHEFRKLILSVWAFQLNLSPREVERQLKAHKIEPPPEWRIFFERDRMDDTTSQGLLARLLQRVKFLFVSNDLKYKSSFQPHLDALINTLETQLEVHRDSGD